MIFKSFAIYKDTFYYSTLYITDLEFYLGTSDCPRGKLIYKGTDTEGHYLLYGTPLSENTLQTLKEILGYPIKYECTLALTSTTQEYSDTVLVPNYNKQSNTFYKEKL